jgi:hypothetical protein
VELVKDTTFRKGKKYFSPVLKVPRHGHLVLLVQVCLTEDENFGSEKGRGLGYELCYEQWKELYTGFY